MSVKSALCSCLSLALPLLALPVAAHNETLAPGLSARLHLATSWRSDDQQTEEERAAQEVWQIPGVLMGGHAAPYERETTLDEASLWLTYRTPEQSYVVVKAGSHGGSELALEYAYAGQQLHAGSVPLQVEAGRMMAFFSPLNHQHPSTELFSLNSLAYSALLGGHVQDDGVRLSLGNSDAGFSAGLEAYKGSAFPAAGSGGMHTAFVRLAGQGAATDWQLQGWYLSAQADNRQDDRSASGHSHSASVSTAFSGRFNGDTDAAGLYLDTGWRWAAEQRLGLRAEWLTVTVDGRVENDTATQEIGLAGDYQALLLEPSLRWQAHTLALRYERLSIQNSLTGAAVGTLGAEAGLINQGHNPQRLSVAWNWQYQPALLLRLEWLQDKAMPDHQPQVLMLGGVWKHSLF